MRKEQGIRMLLLQYCIHANHNYVINLCKKYTNFYQKNNFLEH